MGRHNAVDKVVGARILAGEPVPPVLVLSGRIGFELVQKAVVSGVSAIVAVGAPTSLALSLAQDGGMVLVGFNRSQRCVVYAGARPRRRVTEVLSVASPSVAACASCTPPTGTSAGRSTARTSSPRRRRTSTT